MQETDSINVACSKCGTRYRVSPERPSRDVALPYTLKSASTGKERAVSSLDTVKRMIIAGEAGPDDMLAQGQEPAKKLADIEQLATYLRVQARTGSYQGVADSSPDKAEIERLATSQPDEPVPDDSDAEAEDDGELASDSEEPEEKAPSDFVPEKLAPPPEDEEDAEAAEPAPEVADDAEAAEPAPEVADDAEAAEPAPEVADDAELSDDAETSEPEGVDESPEDAEPRREPELEDRFKFDKASGDYEHAVYEDPVVTGELEPVTADKKGGAGKRVFATILIVIFLIIAVIGIIYVVSPTTIEQFLP